MLSLENMREPDMHNFKQHSVTKVKCFFQLFGSLVQGLANFFCKGPISEYFQFWQPDGLCGNHSAIVA